MLDILIDTLIDGIKLLPFLFFAYLIMEILEHKTSNKTKNIIQKSGKFGPLLGGILGIFPQCGFSAICSNLYAGRVITLGTLISIFLSTSDEMLPILISESAPFDVILKILGIKLIIGIIAGFIVDFVIHLTCKTEKIEEEKIGEICEHEHCHCEEGSILKSSLNHTLSIFIYILIVTLILNVLIHLIGEEALSSLIQKSPILGPVIAGIIGLIPNCASSVILTQLYLSNVISISTMISGLLVGAGVGILILFRVNKNVKENIKIVILLYSIGIIAGITLQLCGLHFF